MIFLSTADALDPGPDSDSGSWFIKAKMAPKKKKKEKKALKILEQGPDLAKA